MSELLDLYLSKDITKNEYIEKKEQLLNQKITLKNKLLACDSKEWLEPALNFINEVKTTKKIALSTDFEEKADLFKKVGLNRKLKQFSIQYEPRGAWGVLFYKRERSERGTASADARANIKTFALCDPTGNRTPVSTVRG